MTWSALFLSIYTVIGVLFLESTYREGRRGGGHWDWLRIFGLLLCLVWPLALVWVLISAYKHRQAG
jgi:hypothetical protein